MSPRAVAAAILVYMGNCFLKAAKEALQAVRSSLCNAGISRVRREVGASLPQVVQDYWRQAWPYASLRHVFQFLFDFFVQRR